MSICESEENRKKLAWLVPGYILLAWFFCVLFQPLSIRSPSSSSSSSGLLRRHGLLSPSPLDAHYKVIYLNPDGAAAPDVCRGNGSVVVLRPGPLSAAVVRLSPSAWYPYRPFNCSLKVEAGEGLDGVTAVVEEMDLRQHEDDARQPGGHWGSSVCLDYVEAYTEESASNGEMNKLCGDWSVGRSERLTAHGPRQTLVGYCFDDRSGHSCESRAVFLNVVLDAERQRGRGRGVVLQEREKRRRRKGFSIVFTGYRHADNGIKDEEDAGLSPCSEGEFSCAAKDFSVHSGRPHCVWDRLRCDMRQNCGFLHNSDEEGCGDSGSVSSGILSAVGGGVGRAGGGGGIHTWSISTMTLLIIVYLAIVLVLVLVTMVLLRWHKTLRTPLDVLAESRDVVAAEAAAERDRHYPHRLLPPRFQPAASALVSTSAASFPPPAASAIATSSSTASEAQDSVTATTGRRGTVSIIVAYRPQQAHLATAAGLAAVPKPPNGEAPPSYDSLFTGGGGGAAGGGGEIPPPPNYNILTLNLPEEDVDQQPEEIPGTEFAAAATVASDASREEEVTPLRGSEEEDLREEDAVAAPAAHVQEVARAAGISNSAQLSHPPSSLPPPQPSEGGQQQRPQ